MQTMLKQKQHITNATIVSMMKVLNDTLKTDNQLASELLHFLNLHQVEVPMLSTRESANTIPVSFTYKNADEQLHKVKPSFEGLETAEYLL